MVTPRETGDVAGRDAIARLDASSKPARQLAGRLEVVAAAVSTAESVDALVGLARWLGEGRELFEGTLASDTAVLESGRTQRLRLLIESTAHSTMVAAALGRVVGRVVSQTSGIELFAHTGLPSERGFVGETIDRMTRRILPSPRDDDDLGAVLARLFPTGRDAAWLAAVPPSLIGQLLTNLPPLDWSAVRRGALEAITLLGTRISAIGLSRELFARARPVDLARSPFIRLSRACDTFADSSAATTAELITRADACRIEVAACRAEVVGLYKSLEATGVSVEVVYQLNVLDKALRRVEALLEIAAPIDGDVRDAAIRLVAALVVAHQKAARVTEILHDNLQLLAKKIVERSGQSGEHYITADRASYFGMLRSAMGGGVLTAGTVLVKFLLMLLSLPLFLQGMTASLNYAASFVAMQLFHFTLATKQPAMTAASLAHALAEGEHATNRFEAITELIARITRSQLAAAIGNISAVIPAVLAIDALWMLTSGEHILSARVAHHALESLDPVRTPTILFAAYTGVLLWLSSVLAGWIDNWSVYHRLPEAMEQHSTRKVVGERAMGAVGRFLTRNLSGLTGNISLGFLLGMTGPFGNFFGIPIEVRHVTLSTGSLALAVVALGPHTMLTQEFGFACVGILLIGLLNFGISFALALTVAFRARGIGVRERFGLGSALYARWRRSWRDFFCPPRGTLPPPVA